MVHISYTVYQNKSTTARFSVLYFPDWSVFFVLVLKGELNSDVEDKSFQQFLYVDAVECRLLKTKVRGKKRQVQQ